MASYCLSRVSRRLQASKLLATAVGLLVALGVLSDLGGLFSRESSVVDPAVVLTVVGLGVAVVVCFEAVSAAVRLVAPSGGRPAVPPTGYRCIRLAELSVAICLVGGVVLWLLGALGDVSTRGGSPPTALSGVAAGMLAVSFVQSTVAVSGRTAETEP